MLVGWSYGGFIICDYVRAHGQDRIAAINLAGGVVALGPAAFGTVIGPGFLDHFPDAIAEDLPANIRGMRGLVKGWPAEPYPPEEIETLLCSAMVVPARIRANLAAREIDGDDVLRTLHVPLLVSHGHADTVVLPAMADHILATCPVAEPSWYDGVGHIPFLEQPERFNRELGRADPPRRHTSHAANRGGAQLTAWPTATKAHRETAAKPREGRHANRRERYPAVVRCRRTGAGARRRADAAAPHGHRCARGPGGYDHSYSSPTSARSSLWRR